MDSTTQGLLLTLLGVVIGALTVLAWRVSETELHGPVEDGEPEAAVVNSLAVCVAAETCEGATPKDSSVVAEITP